ncbi:hypothetical protein OMCYN_01732 [cyanobiont of Ornithocercus magnificus]|nr:hypothetical protein OMCYN_01732 [cyanobiont of Ornithocercus magnificus]
MMLGPCPGVLPNSRRNLKSLRYVEPQLIADLVMVEYDLAPWLRPTPSGA